MIQTTLGVPTRASTSDEHTASPEQITPTLRQNPIQITDLHHQRQQDQLQHAFRLAHSSVKKYFNSNVQHATDHLNESDNAIASSSNVGDSPNHEDSPAPNVQNILLYTYMRSGSSYLGELFNRNPSVFYWFEPLAALYEMFNRGRSSKYWFYTEDFTRR